MSSFWMMINSLFQFYFVLVLFSFNFCISLCFFFVNSLENHRLWTMITHTVTLTSFASWATLRQKAPYEPSHILHMPLRCAGVLVKTLFLYCPIQDLRWRTPTVRWPLTLFSCDAKDKKKTWIHATQTSSEITFDHFFLILVKSLQKVFPCLKSRSIFVVNFIVLIGDVPLPLVYT